MRGRKPTELETLNTSLATVEDPYNLAELRTHSVEELLNALRGEFLYTVVTMGRAGRLLMALKEKTPHGHWEALLDSQHIPRGYARGCMKVVEVVARYPQAIHLPPGRATQQLLYSSMAKIDAVLSGLPEAAVRMLTPWDLALVYDREKLKERRKQAQATPRPPRKPLPQIDMPLEETPFGQAYYTALSALGALVAVEIPASEYDRIFRRGLLPKLARVWDAVIEHLHPIEEIHRHAEIIIPRTRYAPDAPGEEYA